MDPALAIEVAAMSRQRALDEAIARGGSPVQEFYRHCTVLVTGGSGFMGKQLIEKLLRSCEISKMFVLLRSKKGKQIHERLDDMLQDPVFEKLRKQDPDFEQKLVPIAGDAKETRLGISDQDWETLTNQVDVVFHMAATTRFDEPLQVATLINVRGTRDALALGRSCKKLKSFVHVSTAYAQARNSFVGRPVLERFYETPVPPRVLVAMAETMDATRFNSLTHTMIEDWPNTYTFTKAVAEDLIRTESEGLPVCVVRPSIVIASYREPSPGWLDMSCAYGASGIIIGVGLGMMHVAYKTSHATFGLVPCDFVNNAIIVAGKENATEQGPKIYTVSSVARNCITQGQFQKITETVQHCIFTPKAVYCVGALEISNKHLFLLLTWLLHFIPGYILDGICFLLGKERKFVKIYDKIFKMTSTLGFFTNTSFDFNDQNLVNLHKGLSKTDKVIFDFDIPTINWEEYTKIWCVGIRKYILKDGLKDTDKARRKQFWFRILHYFIVTAYIFLWFKILCIFFNILVVITSFTFRATLGVVSKHLDIKDCNFLKYIQ